MSHSFESRSALADALLRIVPESAEFQWSRAELDAELAQSSAAQEKWSEAVDLYKSSIRQKEEIVNQYPDAAHWKLALGKSFIPLALLYEKLGDLDEAAALFRKGIEILEAIEKEPTIAEDVTIALQSLHYQMSNHMLQRILAFRNPNDHA